MNVAHESANFRFVRNITINSSENSGESLASQPASKVSYKHRMKSSRQSELTWVLWLARLHTNSPLYYYYYYYKKLEWQFVASKLKNSSYIKINEDAKLITDICY